MNWDILPELNINFLEITSGAVKVIAIILVAFGTVKFLNRTVRNSVAAHLSKILHETPDQLAARSKTLSMIITSALSILIWVMAAIMILSELGVQVAPLLAGLGVASLTVGFAAQNIVKDYLHGFFIITEDWYRVGEMAVVSVTTCPGITCGDLSTVPAAFSYGTRKPTGFSRLTLVPLSSKTI